MATNRSIGPTTVPRSIGTQSAGKPCTKVMPRSRACDAQVRSTAREIVGPQARAFVDFLKGLVALL